jgi:hypothetical protein
LKVSLPGYSVWLRAWQVQQVGRVKLYVQLCTSLADALWQNFVIVEKGNQSGAYDHCAGL